MQLAFAGLKLNHLSRQLFRVGIILSAIVMPLEITPAKLTLLLSIIATLLLAQFGLVKLLGAEAEIKVSSWVAATTLALMLIADSVTSGMLVAAYPSVAIHGTLSIIHLIARSILILWLADKSDLKLFERSLLWVGAAMVAFGFFQYFGDLAGIGQRITHLAPNYSSSGTFVFPRVQALAHEPLYFANFLLLPLGILIVRGVKEQLSRYLTILLVLSLALFWTTLSRGAIVGLLISLLFLIFARRSNLHSLKSLGKIIGLSVLLMTLLVGIAGLVRHRNSLGAFTGHAVNFGDQSFTSRSGSWPESLKALRTHPLLGLGIGNSREFLDPLGAKAGIPNSSLPVFNNTYVTFIAEQGLLGMALVIPLGIIVIGLIIYSVKHGFSNNAGAYALAIIALAAQANTFEAFVDLRTWMLIGFGLAALRIDLESSKKIGQSLVSVTRELF